MERLEQERKIQELEELRRKVKQQPPVVRRLDNAIHRINRYPVDKC